MKYLPLFLITVFAATSLQASEEISATVKRNRDPASELHSEGPMFIKSAKTETGSSGQIMISGEQVELNLEDKSVSTTKEAISCSDEVKTNHPVALALLTIPPNSLGGMIQHISYLLSLRDLGRLALVSKVVRSGLFYKRIWMGRTLKLSLSVPFLGHIFTCGYPFKCNPVEFVFDDSKPILIAQNMAFIFRWIIENKTSNITLNFNNMDNIVVDDADFSVEEIEEADICAEDGSCLPPSSLNMLEMFGNCINLMKNDMPTITSLGLSNSKISSSNYPPRFCKGILTLFPGVKHLTLDGMTANGSNNLLSVPNLSKLTALESLTLSNYSNNYPIFYEVNKDFFKPTLTSLTMRNFWTEECEELPKVWPPSLQSLELEDVIFDSGNYVQYLTPLIQNTSLKSLVIRGCPFWGPAAEEEKNKYNKNVLLFIQSKFSHLERLELDLSYGPKTLC